MKKLITICAVTVLFTAGYARAGTAWTALDYPGATGTFAHGISGNSIVGRYDDTSGNEHGFVYTVPEPATLFLLGLGAVMLRKTVARC